MARGKQKLPGGDSDFLKRVMATLDVNQTKLAEILGFSNAGVSFAIRENSTLQKGTKHYLRTLMAARNVQKALDDGRALTSFKPCQGHTITDFTKWLIHFEQCPTCLARTYIQTHRK